MVVKADYRDYGDYGDYGDNKRDDNNKGGG